MGSGQSSFYATFSPRTVDAGDLLDHCDDMICDLEEGAKPAPLNDWHCCSCDGCDFDDGNDDCVSTSNCETDRTRLKQTDKEDACRREALFACVRARGDVQANDSKVGQSYHECRDLFNTWRYTYA